jgi:hypothetical protein
MMFNSTPSLLCITCCVINAYFVDKTYLRVAERHVISNAHIIIMFSLLNWILLDLVFANYQNLDSGFHILRIANIFVILHLLLFE